MIDRSGQWTLRGKVRSRHRPARVISPGTSNPVVSGMVKRIPAAYGAPVRKDRGVQSLRGVAVLLMVAGHVIGSSGEDGLTVGDDSWWRVSYLAPEGPRMPVLAVLSGFVYAYRPTRGAEDARRLLRGKVRRLLIPYLTVGIAFVLVQMVTPGTNYQAGPAELPGDFLMGVAHLWFLQAIFLIF